MNWKKLYEHLETSDEGKDILSEVKEGVKEFGDTEAKLRLATKSITEAQDKITELETFKTTVSESGEEKSQLERDVETLKGKLNKMTLDREADEQKLKDAKTQEHKNTIKSGVGDQMSKLFGDKLGGYMTDDYINDGSLNISDDGVSVTFKHNDALYTGNEVIEQIRTLNPDVVVGDSGSNTTGGAKGAVKVANVADLSAHEAFDLAFDSMTL